MNAYKIDVKKGTYEPMAGSNIPACIFEMTGLAKEHARTFSGTFNGIEILAAPNDSPSERVQRWEALMKESGERYRNSPEGRKQAQEAIEKRVRLQAKANQLLESLPSIDWNDLSAILSWFESFQEASDYVGVNIPAHAIVGAFAVHGYFPNMNVGDLFKAEDEGNVARYIIGQALDLLNRCRTIHGVYHTFLSQYREKFHKGVPA